ncbi:MAG: hypothetical protein AAF403_03595, partial [Pseudomonadota bacterium]
LYSTHSPFLISINDENIENTYIIKNDSSDTQEETVIKLIKLKQCTEEDINENDLKPITTSIIHDVINKQSEHNLVLIACKKHIPFAYKIVFDGLSALASFKTLLS